MTALNVKVASYNKEITVIFMKLVPHACIKIKEKG